MSGPEARRSLRRRLNIDAEDAAPPVDRFEPMTMKPLDTPSTEALLLAVAPLPAGDEPPTLLAVVAVPEDVAAVAIVPSTVEAK